MDTELRERERGSHSVLRRLQSCQLCLIVEEREGIKEDIREDRRVEAEAEEDMEDLEEMRRMIQMMRLVG